MIYIGMIYQYDETEETGRVMLPEGESREFSRSEWTESEREPAVGLKVAYVERPSGVQIKLANDEDKIGSVYEEEAEEEEITGTQEPEPQECSSEFFGSVDECISYYVGRGFKKIKDITEGESRTVTLRMYTPAEYGEVNIKQEGSKLSVSQMINGETQRIC